MSNITERIQTVTNELKRLVEEELIDITVEDVYTSVVEKFFSGYGLPALELWENGFSKGSATDEEMFKLANLHNIEILKEDEPNFDAVIDFLDKEFASSYEEALEEMEASYIKISEDSLREVLEKEHKTAYKFEWTGWRIPIYFDVDGNSADFSSGGWLSQGSYQPDAIEVGKVERWELEEDGISDFLKNAGIPVRQLLEDEKIEEIIDNEEFEGDRENQLQSLDYISFRNYEFEESDLSELGQSEFDGWIESSKQIVIDECIDEYINQIKETVEGLEELEGKKIIWE